MKAVTALIVAAVCIQAAEAVQLKSKSFKELAQTEAVTDGRWVKMDGKLRLIDIADDETIIGSNEDLDIFVKFGIADQWKQLPLPGKFIQVSTGGRDRYVGSNADWDYIGLWNATTQHWGYLPKLPGGVAWVSIGHDGTIWAVNSHTEVFRFHGGDKWERMPGHCGHSIYVKSATRISCVKNGDVCFWNATMEEWTCRSYGKWIRHAAISSTGGVATITNCWSLYNANEIYYSQSPEGDWQQIPGALFHISISKDYMIGTNYPYRDIYWLDLKK